MYNLLAGYSFFFEDDSSEVVGHILDIPCGGSFPVYLMESSTGISQESLYPFLEQLERVGLITRYPMSESVVMEYRKFLRDNGFKPELISSSSDQLQVPQSDAEKAYIRRTKVPAAAVMFELTYNCSEKCIHCYNPGATRNDDEVSYRNRKELTLNDYKRIIDDLYSNGLIKACLTGGDPFSKPRVWEIIGYLRDKDVAVEVFTNGQRLYGREEELASYFPSDVGISLYGPNAEVHDAITRVKGSFAKSMAVLERLSELHVPTAIKCSLMRSNFKFYPEMFGLAERLGADLQIECRLFDGLDGDRCVSRYLRLTPDQMRIVFRDKRLPYYVGEELEDYGAIPQDMEHIACRAGVQNFCITPEGLLIPCCSYHAVLGDLTQTRVSEILKGNIQLERLVSTPISSYVECGRHDYCSFCKMCPGLNFAENGTPLKPAENNCYIAKLRYQLSEDLRNGRDPLQGASVETTLKGLGEEYSSTLRREMAAGHLNETLSI